MKTSLTGSHDGFPNYELYAEGQLIYSHDAVASDNDPADLFPPAEVLATKTVAQQRERADQAAMLRFEELDLDTCG